MAGDTSEGTRELDQTPTWAVAGVCAIIIVVSIALEKVLHRLGKVTAFPPFLLVSFHFYSISPLKFVGFCSSQLFPETA